MTNYLVGPAAPLDAPSAVRLSRARRSLPPPSERRRIREEAGVSRDSMAAPLGVTGSAVYRWETGTEPGPRHVVAYLELLEQLRAEADR